MNYYQKTKTIDLSISQQLYMKEAKRKFMIEKHKQILQLEWDLDMIGPHSQMIKDHLEELKIRRKHQLAEKRLDKYIFLTISQDKYDFTNNYNTDNRDKLLQIIDKQCNRKFINTYHYVIEQRGTVKENNIGKGCHIHLLFERKLEYKPAIIKRDLKSGFKKLFLRPSSLNNNSIFNFKKCGEEYYLKRLEYIKGNKEEDKQQKCEADKIFREKLKIKEYYSN